MPEGGPVTRQTLNNAGVPAPHRARVAALIAMVLLGAAATGWILDGVREGGDLSSWDGPTLSWLVGHREAGVTAALTAVTTVGGEVVLATVALVTVLYLAGRRHRVEAFLLAVALGSADARSLGLKHVVGRVRPPADVVVGPLNTRRRFPRVTPSALRRSRWRWRISGGAPGRAGNEHGWVWEWPPS